MTIVGNPVTESTVRELPGYKKKETITPFDLAKVAAENQGTYEADAKSQLTNEAKECDRNVITTVCIYNASGRTLYLKDQQEWRGTFWTTPPDGKIQNGQWSTFLHTKTSWGTSGSCGCVVYTMQSDGDKEAFFGWQNPWNRSYKGQVFNEVMPKGHFWDDVTKDWLLHLLDQEKSGNLTKTDFGYNVTGSIGNYERSTAVYVIQPEGL